MLESLTLHLCRTLFVHSTMNLQETLLLPQSKIDLISVGVGEFQKVHTFKGKLKTEVSREKVM